MESIVDQPKIHFYQFMSIEVVDEYILTGIEYMVKSLLNSTQKLVSLRYYSHEIATFLSGIKDLFFLIKRKGTYAQNFYGLQRVNQRSKMQIAIEMIVWVVMPYLVRKIQAKFNELKQRAQSGARLGTIANLFTKIFPILYCILKITTTVIKFRYLIDKTSKYYNIEYLATRTELGYIETQQPSPFPIMSLLKSPGLFIALVAHKIASYAFSNDKKKKGKDEIIQISAPIADQDKKQKQCPICGKKFRNPAVLRSSGYVFCYGCIVPEIRSNRKCPVTSIASDESQIQIIYQ